MRPPRSSYLISQTSQALKARLEKSLRPLEVTGLQYTVMSIIAARGGVSSSGLSRLFFVTPQAMHEVVSGLERRGLLERVVDETNRRVRIMSLSRSGQELLKVCDARVDEVEDDAFASLSDQQLQQMRRVLTVLLNELRDTGRHADGRGDRALADGRRRIIERRRFTVQERGQSVFERSGVINKPVLEKSKEEDE